MAKTQKQADGRSEKPVWDYVLGGIKGAVWQNSGQHGTFYNFTLERLYEDQQSGETRYTRGFRKSDAGNVKEVTGLCLQEIIRLEQDNER